jgi:hypothetical protein
VTTTEPGTFTGWVYTTILVSVDDCGS